VIEYTATPANNSNMIESLSAQDLKDEEMIKLPVVLQEHGSWQQAIAASIQTHARLEQAAHKETDYIRPLVLFQAENKGRRRAWRRQTHYTKGNDARTAGRALCWYP